MYNSRELTDIHERRPDCNAVFRHFADTDEILRFRKRGHNADFFVYETDVFFTDISSKITAQNVGCVADHVHEINDLSQI